MIEVKPGIRAHLVCGEGPSIRTAPRVIAKAGLVGDLASLREAKSPTQTGPSISRRRTTRTAVAKWVGSSSNAGECKQRASLPCTHRPMSAVYSFADNASVGFAD